MKSVYKIIQILTLYATAGIFVASAMAQTPSAISFLPSWRALSYVSPKYHGKILPTPGTRLIVSFEMLDGARIADISKNSVIWLKNGKRFDSGIGKKITSFAVDPLDRNERVDVKILVRAYKGADQDFTFTIPVAAPELVIAAPYPKNIISGGTYQFTPLFYYWNIRSPLELSVEWLARGQGVAGLSGADKLQLSIPAVTLKTLVPLSASAKNPADEFEFAAASLNLTAQ